MRPQQKPFGTLSLFGRIGPDPREDRKKTSAWREARRKKGRYREPIEGEQRCPDCLRTFFLDELFPEDGLCKLCWPEQLHAVGQACIDDALYDRDRTGGNSEDWPFRLTSLETPK